MCDFSGVALRERRAVGGVKSDSSDGAAVGRQKSEGADRVFAGRRFPQGEVSVTKFYSTISVKIKKKNRWS